MLSCAIPLPLSIPELPKAETRCHATSSERRRSESNRRIADLQIVTQLDSARYLVVSQRLLVHRISISAYRCVSSVTHGHFNCYAAPGRLPLRAPVHHERAPLVVSQCIWRCTVGQRGIECSVLDTVSVEKSVPAAMGAHNRFTQPDSSTSSNEWQLHGSMPACEVNSAQRPTRLCILQQPSIQPSPASSAPS
jgi:hypothetical protein